MLPGPESESLQSTIGFFPLIRQIDLRYSLRARVALLLRTLLLRSFRWLERYVAAEITYVRNIWVNPQFFNPFRVPKRSKNVLRSTPVGHVFSGSLYTLYLWTTKNPRVTSIFFNNESHKIWKIRKSSDFKCPGRVETFSLQIRLPHMIFFLFLYFIFCEKKSNSKKKSKKKILDLKTIFGSNFKRLSSYLFLKKRIILEIICVFVVAR